MGSRSSATSAAIALVVSWWAGVAGASPSARLTYVRSDAAAACPDEAALRSAVASRLGYDPFFPSAAKSVVAEVSRGDKGFRGRVVILDERGVSRGERVFPPSGNDCGETVRAMALAISIAIDDLAAETPAAPDAPAPSGGETPPPSSPAAVPPEPAAPASPSPPPAPPPVATEPPTPIEIRAALGPHVGIGLAPSVGVGGRVGVAMVVSRFSLGLEGRIDAPASTSLPAGGRVETSHVGGALLGCVHGGIPFACAVLGLGSFTGNAQAIAAPKSESALVILPGVRVGVEAPVGERWVVRGFGGLELPVPRHEVQVDRVSQFRLPIVAALIGADVALRFR